MGNIGLGFKPGDRIGIKFARRMKGYTMRSLGMGDLGELATRKVDSIQLGFDGTGLISCNPDILLWIYKKDFIDVPLSLCESDSFSRIRLTRYR